VHRFAIVRSCLLALLATGCAHYFYYARAANADGAGHEALASWSVTQRTLWFDESSETVRVTLQCGKTVAFQQRGSGVYMLYDPTAWSDPKLVEGKPYCGRVPGVRRIDQLEVGSTLNVEVWCAHHEDDEGMSIAAPILTTGQHTLGVVARSDTEPQVKPCSAEPRR
ncbi:MAG: hypothetical protein ACHQ53_09770, partial [Polyangiales bacterium]